MDLVDIPGYGRAKLIAAVLQALHATYGCTYFEIYVPDLDDPSYWPSFQQWHDLLSR